MANILSLSVLDSDKILGFLIFLCNSFFSLPCSSLLFVARNIQLSLTSYTSVTVYCSFHSRCIVHHCGSRIKNVKESFSSQINISAHEEEKIVLQCQKH